MRLIKGAVLSAGIALSLGMALAVQAKEVSINGNSHSQVKDRCGGKGDVYWVEGETGSTYGCLHANGSGIVCGGVTAQQKKTCSTFREASFPKPDLPTRDAIRKLNTKD